jgi:hypothetical protein
MKTTMQEITMDEALVIAIMRKAILCEVCGETRGGAIGNGQVVDGVVLLGLLFGGISIPVLRIGR